MNDNDQPICETDRYGNKYWYLNDKLHREDGPAIEYANGAKQWHLNGKRHRVDGPAIVDTDNYKEWYFNDKLHRVDGPAIEFTSGDKRWYYQGIDFTKKYKCNSQEVFNRLLKLQVLW
jgi:hypothetical protein